MLLGDKIRSLRKRKNITQTELADILSVTAQTVSKWENHISDPDISLLPVIARYFGITMDELFQYRLDALNYKERFIRFMVDNGMLRFGEFVLKSRRCSPYLIHSGYQHSGSQISKLGECYAECIREHGLESHCLIGIHDREIALVVATGMTLFHQYGIDMPHCIDDRAIRTLLHDGNSESFTLITDTFTSGKTLCLALDQIRDQVGAYPSHIIVSVDRMERSENSPLSAKHEIEKHYGVTIHSIVTAEDILKAIDHGVISAGEYDKPLREYVEIYKGL